MIAADIGPNIGGFRENLTAAGPEQSESFVLEPAGDGSGLPSPL